MAGTISTTITSANGYIDDSDTGDGHGEAGLEVRTGFIANNRRPPCAASQ
jgi:hypothetical protein